MNLRDIQKDCFLVFAVIVSLFLAVGCGGGGGDPASGPIISSDRSMVDFGNQVIGQTTEREVVLTNPGTANLEIGEIPEPGGVFAVKETCSNRTLAPHASCTMVLHFMPTEQLEYNGSLQVDSNAGSLSVGLTGVGKGLNVGISNIIADCANSTVTAKVLVSSYEKDPVSDLDQNNFAVYMNDNLVEPFSIAAVPVGEPVSVALALDWSNSFREYVPAVQQSSLEFIDLLQSGDRAAVFKFATNVDEAAQPFIAVDTGRDTLESAIEANFIGTRSPTMTWDAVDYVVRQTANEINEKRAVILLTDGYDDGSKISLADLIKHAQDNNVAIFTIGLGTVNVRDLEQLAQETGGIYFDAVTTDYLQDIYQDIVHLLTNQYELTFTNPSPTTENLLRIVVSDNSSWTGEGTREVPSCP
jgi:hypothetical protein